MKIRKLSLVEIKDIYTEHLCRDFPPAELKPLDRIEIAFREGRYCGDGAFGDAGELIGYAFWVVIDQKYLLDYYAIVPAMRQKGYGTRFLKDILQETDAELLLIEIEDPQAADGAEKKTERLRRFSFYERVECLNTEVRMMAFGVEFLLLEYARGRAHTKQEITDGYLEIYKAILPKRLFEQEICVM